ncbi:MAG: hypothetical protein CVV42_10385 [Candidatus Riflebacteria bacterium HGW-Riflebacteria-2]|nr:MAG: hypothetical protein CVV42_10385 [Candidatus Riflebacteria bacterium HGW-Riflebacteria-2]
MQSWWRGLLILVTIILALPPGAQASSWQVFNEASGINGRVINCFASFKTVMAVGTDKGVSIYSGNTGTWSAVALPDQVASMPIKDIAFDEHGHLWLATANGLVSIQGQKVSIYGARQNLPTIDIDRVQTHENRLYIGCFGGYVAQAYVPQSGSTAFTPVNYSNFAEEDRLKIKSVGVSGMAMTGPARGWFSTRGGGLIEINGASQYPASSSDGSPELWINDFFIFPGKSREQHIIAATPQHLSLIKNNRAQHEISLPMQDPWLNCVITVKEPDEIFELLKQPEMSSSEEALFDFLGKHSLYAGTRNNGLWRFQRGKWTQYLTTNSILPSDSINRLYAVERLLIVCTDGGLVLIHLDSNQYDEFKKEGLGRAYFKTFFPFPPLYAVQIPNFQIVKGSSYWFSHQHGLTRWRSASFPKNYDQQTLPDVSTRIEPQKEGKAGHLDSEEPELPTDDVSEEALRGYWQLFTKEFLTYDNIDLFEIPEQKITWMTIDRNSGYLWLIFNKNQLARMRMEKQVSKKDGKKQKIEMPDWQIVDKYVPWSDGTELNIVWFTPDSIYVGTKNDGFYILKNPGSRDLKKEPFEWQHHNIFNGLPDSDVRGFAQWNSPQGRVLAIMHYNQVNLWDGKFYSRLDIGGGRHYTCIASGEEGNLWVGSVGGLQRVDPAGHTYSYGSANAFFDSNRITAIGTLPRSSEYELGVWVACDERAGDNEMNTLFEGSDISPAVVTDSEGNKLVIEFDTNNSSFHYFDGLTWDKWKMGGIRNIFIDREYVWVTTNLRVRRLRIPR